MTVKFGHIIIGTFQIIVVVLYSQFVRYESNDPPFNGFTVKNVQRLTAASLEHPTTSALTTVSLTTLNNNHSDQASSKVSKISEMTTEMIPDITSSNTSPTIQSPSTVPSSSNETHNISEESKSPLSSERPEPTEGLNITSKLDIIVSANHTEIETLEGDQNNSLNIYTVVRHKRSGGGQNEHSATSNDPSNTFNIYPMFIDVHIMIIVGFGFLMTFLKKYSYSSVGFNLLICGIMIQWAILCQGIFNTQDGFIHIGTKTLLSSDIAVASILISFGAVLGKTSPTQLIIMGIIEMVLFACNEHLTYHVFHAADIGGSIVVHVFGAYFGLAVSFMLYRKGMKRDNEGASYNSDMFAMIGSLFLWIMWPSFNMGLANPGDNQRRAMINTYLSLAASVATTFALSSLVEKGGHLDMVHVQNSTLAGGVLMGAIANTMLHPFGAVIVGSIGGVVSVTGYKYLQELFFKKLKLHDTCGVQFLHGIPGVISGLFSILVAGIAKEEEYGYSLYDVYPARVPELDSPEYQEIIGHMPHFEPGTHRSAAMQAAYQAVSLGVTFGIAIGGGLVTGFIIRMSIFDPTYEEEVFNDESYWEVPHDDIESQGHDDNYLAKEGQARPEQFNLGNIDSSQPNRAMQNTPQVSS